MKSKILIWWTNQADCETIDVMRQLFDRFPDYILEQFGDRYGRNGRGRLWVDEQFGDVSVSPWPDSALGRILGETPTLGQTYAGIVIRQEHADLFFDMPGVLTDLQLVRPPIVLEQHQC
jgi:hypothetical protein